MDAWNQLCGVELFQRGGSDIRILFVDTLGEGKWAVSGASIVVAEDRWLDGSRADHIAVLGHELYHRLAAGYDGTDGYGHTQTGGWSRATGGLDWPNAADRAMLVELGYPCK